jgi:hypothetical protein
MSFIVTAYVREGIVMASDSRLTLNATQQQNQQQITNLDVGQTDSTYKTFLALNKFGISTFGEASINGVPIAGYIESFISEHLSQNNYEIDQLPQELLTYFRNISPNLGTGFHVGGYKRVNNLYEQHIWAVQINQNNFQRLNTGNNQGVSWGGEGDILSRIIKPAYSQDQQGNYQPYPNHQIPYQFFTLQDAIDFSVYAIRTTTDTIRFQPRAKTVGGPIDVLVLKPDAAKWIRQKELKVKID